uniref:Neur_chan_memb domain-containing protein n=1 Tax=Ascaris lumbricoides TaxID=6252 RepID=A0A0M3I9C1_ASCLU
MLETILVMSSLQDMISIILAITFLIFSYNEMMPRVSYIKAMDVYLGVCFMIVFLSLIKLAFVKFMHQRLKLRSETSLVAGMLPALKLATNGLPHMEENDFAIKPPPSCGLDSPIIPRSPIGPYTTIALGESGAHCPQHVVEISGKGYRTRRFKNAFKRWEFDEKSMRRFHWMSQIVFFLGFVSFCMFYFLVYPNLHIDTLDPACAKEKAEWFADIL